MKPKTISELRSHLFRCVALANNDSEIGLPASIQSIRGMSGRKNRNFLYHLCRMDPCSYLEVGTWQGSTLVSAAFGAKHKEGRSFVGIDNFSQFDKDKKAEKELHRNLKTHVPDVNVTTFNRDCWDVDPKIFKKMFNIYNYDGSHKTVDQKKALLHFRPCLAPVFIFVCDDWNFPPARLGTFAGIKEAKLTVEASVEIHTPGHRNSCSDDWWNGTYAAVLSTN